MSLIGERIRAVLAADPEAEAVEFSGVWHRWRELAHTVNALDTALTRAGICAHAPVGLLLRNSPEMVGAMLGVVTTDRCIVTLNPHQGDEKVAADIREVRPPVVVAHGGDWSRPGLREAAREIGSLAVELASGEKQPVRIVGGLERPGPGPHRPALPGTAVEMLTSGTTGAPKRIELSYDSFDRTIRAAGDHYRAGEGKRERPLLSKGVAIVNAPLVHMSGLFRTLLNICEGRRVALLERFAVEPWVDLVRRHQPRAVSLVPAALAMVLEAGVDVADLASIQVVTSGSAKLDPELQLAFERRFEIPVLPSYGATEFAGGVAGWTLPLHREWGERKRGSVGRPQPGRELRVVDRDSGKALGCGEPGLLEVRSERGEWVRTTDLARIDADGFVWIDGRSDDTIVRGGFKIAPAEVAAVLNAHPAVREACVVGLPDSRLGQVPVAAVELLPGESVEPEVLRDFARQRLGAYQVPAQIRIVDRLPRTPSLKVSQPGVRALFGEPL